MGLTSYRETTQTHESGHGHQHQALNELTPLWSNKELKCNELEKGLRGGDKIEDDKTPLNVSDNVLLGFRAYNLQNISWNNFIVAIFSLMYCGLNISLAYFNWANARAKTKGEEKPVDVWVFHMMEFWCTFLFGIVELFALSQTPKHLVSTVQSPRLLKVILFLNVVLTLVPAVLVAINLHAFDILSHEIEYCSEITMSFLELVLLQSLTPLDKENILCNSSTLAAIALCIALIQLGIYNGMGRTPSGGMVGEVPAHYCEFLFEIISSIITCWFAMDNMFIADEELHAILYGDHADCKICATHAVLSDIP
eukprot:GSChrysophyteH2.ASY1.ANO1.631.1 assembled CDS